MRIGLGVPAIKQEGHVVLEFVEVDGLFDQDGTANQDQIIE